MQTAGRFQEHRIHLCFFFFDFWATGHGLRSTWKTARGSSIPSKHRCLIMYCMTMNLRMWDVRPDEIIMPAFWLFLFQKSVRWTDDVVDNENLGRKSSKSMSHTPSTCALSWHWCAELDPDVSLLQLAMQRSGIVSGCMLTYKCHIFPYTCVIAVWMLLLQSSMLQAVWL